MMALRCCAFVTATAMRVRVISLAGADRYCSKVVASQVRLAFFIAAEYLKSVEPLARPTTPIRLGAAGLFLLGVTEWQL